MLALPALAAFGAFCDALSALRGAGDDFARVRALARVGALVRMCSNTNCVSS